jgi:hypothetical protein
MTAQIRPNRMEVSDRFPMLGFAVRTQEPNVDAEVVLASDVALFSPENRERRTAANFYVSSESGMLKVPRGEGIFVVPSDALARFIGSDKLFFGLATGHANNGGLEVEALPREGSPYVSLRGFTGRTLRRNFGGKQVTTTPKLEWAGDAAKPGSEKPQDQASATTPQPDAAPAAPGSKAPYDDGFGPMPTIPARESSYQPRKAVAGAVGINLASGTTPRDALNWIRQKIEQGVAAVGSDVSPPSLCYLGDASPVFVSSWKTGLGLTGLVSPLNAFLAALPSLASETGVTLSIGPALDTPFFGAGVGVVFDPNGQVALFGTADISVDASSLLEFVKSLKLALQAKLKLGYNNGGLAGFASLAKVASIAVGEEIVGGAELWLDGSGSGLGGAVSIGVGLALELAASQAPAKGLVFDKEDMDRARTLARHHQDLFQWMPPQSIVDEMKARGFEIQRIADATGDLSLDHYQVRIDTFPEGWDAPKLLEYFIRHINEFVDTTNTSFDPYSDQDATRIASDNPVGAVLNLDIFGPDNAAIVISTKQPQFYAVTTLRTPDTGDHPVSGHRQFGYFVEDGVTTFYTRGADRSTAPLPGTEWLIWEGAEKLWKSFQNGVVAWISAKGGSATALKPFSERFNASAVRLTYGHFDTAQALGLEPQQAEGAIVQPPTSPRVRAAKIGGEFSPRIEKALDLGLDAATLTPLLDTLDPPTAAIPLAVAKGEEEQVEESLPPAPSPRARAMGAGADAAIAIGGILIESIRDNVGDITWDLDQFRGIKHPNDSAPANAQPFQDGATIKLDQWPSTGPIIDSINAWFSIDWQYNGRSLGNVRINNIGTNDAIGASLSVRAQIMDDNKLYSPNDCAALRVTFHYRFSRPIGSDHIAITVVHLYGDGTWDSDSRWVQADVLGISQGAPGVGDVLALVGGRAIASPAWINVKHPGDVQPPGKREWTRKRIELDHVPWATGPFDKMTAYFTVEWEYDGRSVKNIKFYPEVNTAILSDISVSVDVKPREMEEYDFTRRSWWEKHTAELAKDVAVVDLDFNYTFVHKVDPDEVAVHHVTLYGDGNYWENAEPDWIAGGYEIGLTPDGKNIFGQEVHGRRPFGQ